MAGSLISCKKVSKEAIFLQIKLDLAKLEQIDGIFAMYKKAVESMKRLGIDQWDDAYPDLVTITVDV